MQPSDSAIGKIAVTGLVTGSLKLTHDGLPVRKRKSIGRASWSHWPILVAYPLANKAYFPVLVVRFSVSQCYLLGREWQAP
jgi:hypothetical protein